MSEYNFFSSLSDEKAVLQSNYQLKKENKFLLKETYKLKNELKIEAKTSVLIKKKLSDLTLKITNLKAELNFYQGIVDESSTSRGIFFQKISIIAQPILKNIKELSANSILNKLDMSEFSTYKLDLSIVKKIKSKSYRSGNIKISLLDEKGKNIKQWKLLDSDTKEVKKLKLRFQSFKTLEAYILVKKLSVPSKIQVSFIDALRGNIGVSKEFDWKLNQMDNKGITYVGE